jgi:hypothetical protein
MLLSFAFPALALTVPLRASYHQDIVPGEAAIASYATTASVVSLTNPTTGKVFSVSGDELTANKREATGKEKLSFRASTADSIRTWAVYFIDANGEELGDPEVVDVSFDAEGNGSIAARPSASRITTMSILPSTGSEGGYPLSSVKVSVQDSASNASYIGIQELTNTESGSNLVTDPNMDVMDSAAFATFQALDLDAIVALDSYRIQVEGSVSVAGLAVASDGTIEGGVDLRWDLGFSNGGVTCEKGGTCSATITDALSYSESIGAVKKKSGAVPRVTLKNADLFTLSTDASQSLVFEGKQLDLEVSAAMRWMKGHESQQELVVVALDPYGFGVQARTSDEDTGIILADPIFDVDTDGLGDIDNVTILPPWTYISSNLFDVVVMDSDGGVVSTQTCQMTPTAATLSGTSRRDVLVGECTRDDGTDVRRLRASIGAGGWIQWTVELAGSTFAETTECAEGGKQSCTASSVLGGTVGIGLHGGAPLLSRKLDVTETAFDLPAVFEGDISGYEVDVMIELYSTKAAAWSVSDGVVTAKDGDTVLTSFDTEGISLSASGDCTLKGWAVDGATVPAEIATGPVTLTGSTGHVCRATGD